MFWWDFAGFDDINVNFFVYSAHPFQKKEWYNVLAPGFEKRNITLTPCNKTIGNKLSAENLQGRVFQISQADCDNNAEDCAWRRIKFQV